MLGLHMERSRSRWIYPASTPLNPPRWPSQAKFVIPMSTKIVAVSAWGEFFWILSHDSLSCHVVIIAIKCLNPAPSTKRRHLAWMRNWFGAQAGLLTLFWSKCSVDQVTAGPNLTLFFKGPDNCHLRAKHELTSKHWRQQRFRGVILFFWKCCNCNMMAVIFPFKESWSVRGKE